MAPVLSPAVVSGLFAGLAEKLLPRRPYCSCRQCGICCERWGNTLLVCEEDLKGWRKAGREDLLSRTGPTGEIWSDPATGRRERSCPFLRREANGLSCCVINEVKPVMCRMYPGRIQSFRCVGGVSFLPDPQYCADRMILA